jgi:hypothetical protein
MTIEGSNGFEDEPSPESPFGADTTRRLAGEVVRLREELAAERLGRALAEARIVNLECALMRCNNAIRALLVDDDQEYHIPDS